MNPKYPDCVLWGGYAWGNTGDEITLAVAIDEMRSLYGPNIAVLSKDPEYTKWQFPNVNVIPYRPVKPPYWYRKQKQIGRVLNPFRHHSNLEPHYRLKDQLQSGDSGWMDSVRNAESLYLVGGGYLTDLWDLSFYFLPLEWAACNTVPISTAPIGIGPVHHAKTIARLQKLLSQTKVRVRDTSSLNLCRKIGLEAQLEQDDGFNLDRIVTGLTHPTSHVPKRSDRPNTIGVCFFHQHGCETKNHVLNWWENLLRRLARNGREINGFCFNADRRLDFTHLVALFLHADLSVKKIQAPDLDFRAAVKRLSDYRLVISSRFHSIIAASVMGIPHVAIASGAYYQQKMKAILRSERVPCCMVDPETDSVEQVLDFINEHC